MRVAKIERVAVKHSYWQVHERVWLCWRHYIQHLSALIGRESLGPHIKGPTDFLVGEWIIWCAECHEELGRQAELDFPWENGK